MSKDKKLKKRFSTLEGEVMAFRTCGCFPYCVCGRTNSYSLDRRMFNENYNSNYY